jgi:hypothetical protein
VVVEVVDAEVAADRVGVVEEESGDVDAPSPSSSSSSISSCRIMELEIAQNFSYYFLILNNKLLLCF